ncbi:MAG TPA: MFS transporter [Povalibacter sp.]|nr:MFS transporter [Povalibacter sp.]
MYPLEWIERLKLGRAPAGGRHSVVISPVVLSLGLTSLLTDISSEMVNSLLPAYVVLHLHLNPLQFGVIDGLYNGLAIALLSIVAGFMADRSSRQKGIALAGYGLSGACKLLLLAVGTTYGWILFIVGIDRLGKGIRAAPRDALISLNTPEGSLASAFSVHRAMDACGSLLGPIAAFALLATLPGRFDAVWVASFAFAALGVAALWLLVPGANPAARLPADAAVPRWSGLGSPKFVVLVACGGVLAMTTISDGFVYLVLQQKTALAVGYFPLFYVLTAMGYMLFSIPAGRLADRISRPAVFMGGYALLIALYAVLCFREHIGVGLLTGCLALLGLYYAATEGILMALASAVIAPERRTAGIAIVATAVATGKLVSSIAFGALWQGIGVTGAVLVFGAATSLALLSTVLLLRKHHG